jgi:hypothetical protein
MDFSNRAKTQRRLQPRQYELPGLGWTGAHVGHKSWVERDRLMAPDADPGVVGVLSQPFWADWSVGRGRPMKRTAAADRRSCRVLGSTEHAMDGHQRLAIRIAEVQIFHQ